VKKVLIVAVCFALVLTLAFTLGALGKKPDKPSKPEYVIYFTEDVDGEVYQCGVQGGFISSSNDEDFRPNLCLVGKKLFGVYNICTSSPYGRYLDLSEHKGEITMQFFFIDIDNTGEKVQLNVYGGKLVEGEGEWLSSSFTIKFVGDPAVILPTKGKRDPHWDGTVNITIHCQGK